MSLNIRELVDQQATFWVKWRHGIEIELAYLSLDGITKLFDKSKSFSFNKASRQREETVNRDKFKRLLAKEVVLDWRGLTGETLAMLFKKVNVDNPKEEIPYSVENAEYLLQHAYDFEDFILDTCRDAEEVSIEEKEEERKNS